MKDKNSSRLRLAAIDTVDSPLRFATYALGTVEIGLFALILYLEGVNQTIAIVGAILIFILLIAVVFASEQTRHPKPVIPDRNPLPDPGRNPGVLFYKSPDARDEPKSNALLEVAEPSSAPWAHSEIPNLNEELLRPGLDRWRGLFLSPPFRRHLSQEVIDTIVRWVRNGGRLVVTGYGLGERHHKMNVNQLLYHFGLSLRSDAVVPHDYEHKDARPQIGKGYNVWTTYEVSDTDTSRLFEGVSSLSLRYACTIAMEPGSRPLILCGENRIRELSSRDDEERVVPLHLVDEDGHYELASGEQWLVSPSVTRPGNAIAALAPRGLCGKGGVVVIGTFDFRGKSDDRPATDSMGPSNARFLENLWTWMSGHYEL